MESKIRSFKTVFTRPIASFSPGLGHTPALTHRHLYDGGTVVYSNVHTCHLRSTALVTWSQRKSSVMSASTYKST